MVAVTGLTTLFVVSWKTPEVALEASLTTEGVTATEGWELVTVAEPPLPPAGAVRVNVPEAGDPPNTEVGLKVSLFSTPPAGTVMVTLALVESAGLATLAAVTVTVWVDPRVAGAVYAPEAEREPTG